MLLPFWVLQCYRLLRETYASQLKECMQMQPVTHMDLVTKGNFYMIKSH